MLNILFLLLNLFICAYFIAKKNPAILAYLILFQEIHLVPFDNLNLSGLGYVYYFLISVSFLAYVTKLKWSKKRLFFIVNNYVFLSILIISFLILIHFVFIGLKSESAQTLTVRFYLQIIPALVFLILSIEKKDTIHYLSHGIIVYGILLGLILIFTTDILNVSNLARSLIRDEIGMNPITISKAGSMMFITALLLYMDKNSSMNKIYLILVLFFSAIMIVLGMSRGPLIALLTSLIIYFVISRGSILKNLSYVFSGVLFIVFFILVINFIYDFSYLNVYINRLRELQELQSTSRYIRYQLALEFLKNDLSVTSIYFLLGLGPAGFGYYFHLGHAHNLILELIMEYGIFGVISSLLLSVYSLYYAFQIIRSNIPIRYAYISVIFIFLYIASMFSGDLIANRNLLFVAIIQVIFIYFFKKSGYKVN